MPWPSGKTSDNLLQEASALRKDLGHPAANRKGFTPSGNLAGGGAGPQPDPGHQKGVKSFTY